MSDKLKPNWSAIPNYVLDKVLPTLSKAALKVYLAVARKTYGYQKNRDAIPLTQLQEMTGSRWRHQGHQRAGLAGSCHSRGSHNPRD